MNLHQTTTKPLLCKFNLLLALLLLLLAAATVSAGSGQRIPFMGSRTSLFTAELPPGWVCNCGLGSHRLERAENPDDWLAVSFARSTADPDAYLGMGLNDVVAADLDPDETLVAQESAQAGERPVIIATIEDSYGIPQIRYYVQDSQGQTLILRDRSDGQDAAAMREAALFIAGNVEGEPTEAATDLYDRLRASSVIHDEATQRWRVLDPLRPDLQHTLELPAGWTVYQATSGGYPMLIRDDDRDTSATAFFYLTTVEDPGPGLAVIVPPLVDVVGTSIVDRQDFQVGAREVFSLTINDPDMGGTTVQYFVLDSNNDLINLIVQSYVLDPEALQDDLLTIAGHIEVEHLGWEDRLRQIGALPDSP